MSAAFLGKSLISTSDWSNNELRQIIEVAAKMKKSPMSDQWNNLLYGKTFLILLYNPSLRTHLSFEKAILQLGGHPHYRTPEMGWVKSTGKIQAGESLKDVAKVISKYVDGIGIRITLDAITQYGEGNKILREYEKWAEVPIINLADDMFHPCQALADLMGWAEWYGGGKGAPNIDQLKGKKLLLTWAKSAMARPWSSVQSHLLLAACMGMNIMLAHPKGYELDENVCKTAKQICLENNNTFEITHDPDRGYEGVHVVYARNWITKNAYEDNYLNYQNEVTQSLSHSDWIVTEKRMSKTQNAIFTNPMPIDRGNEAEEAVIESSNSLIYEVAENRLHVQKAILASIIGGLEWKH